MQPSHLLKARRNFTLCPRDLSRWGSGERFAGRDSEFVLMGNHLQDREIHPAEGGGPREPSERERVSWGRGEGDRKHRLSGHINPKKRVRFDFLFPFSILVIHEFRLFANRRRVEALGRRFVLL